MEKSWWLPCFQTSCFGMYFFIFKICTTFRVFSAFPSFFRGRRLCDGKRCVTLYTAMPHWSSSSSWRHRLRNRKFCVVLRTAVLLWMFLFLRLHRLCDGNRKLLHRSMHNCTSFRFFFFCNNIVFATVYRRSRCRVLYFFEILRAFNGIFLVTETFFMVSLFFVCAFSVLDNAR